MNTFNPIWLVLDSRTNGGIESHVLELARALVKRHFSVSVVLLTDYGPHPLHDLLCRENIPAEILDGRLGSLVTRIRSVRPRVIHSHGYKAGLYCCLAAKLTGSFHCSTFHAGEIAPGKVGVYDWLHRQTSRLNDANFSVSEQIARRVPASSRVLDNFVSTPPLAPAHGRRLAFVGRLSHEKGPDLLLDLASRLESQTFHVYGDGAMADELLAKAPANCVFHGNQHSMEAQWRDIDLLLMPSRFEGLPMVALEAMARGIPVIAFDVGALGRVIRSGENGWLVAPGQLPVFKHRIEAWLAMQPAQKRRIRERARKQIVDHFSAEQQLPQLLEQYAIGSERISQTALQTANTRPERSLARSRNFSENL